MIVCKDARHDSSPKAKPKLLNRPVVAGYSIGHKLQWLTAETVMRVYGWDFGGISQLLYLINALHTLALNQVTSVRWQRSNGIIWLHILYCTRECRCIIYLSIKFSVSIYILSLHLSSSIHFIKRWELDQLIDSRLQDQDSISNWLQDVIVCCSSSQVLWIMLRWITELLDHSKWYTFTDVFMPPHSLNLPAHTLYISQCMPTLCPSWSSPDSCSGPWSLSEGCAQPFHLQWWHRGSYTHPELQPNPESIHLL